MLAGHSEYLSYTGVAPVMRDVWGDGLAVLRMNMWLFTTPAMVYLLSVISDFKSNRVSKKNPCILLSCCPATYCHTAVAGCGVP